jgi:hypothetical protein
MLEIVLNPEQAKVVASSLQPVQVRDERGNVLGVIAPAWTEEEIADAKRRLASGEPRLTLAQVLQHLGSVRPC